MNKFRGRIDPEGAEKLLKTFIKTWIKVRKEILIGEL